MMSPSKTVEANGRRVRRALVACDFCRRRKMKCGNETPKCKNCEASNKDCIYFEISKKPRPSNARIDHLEQENRRLQDALRLSLERDTESKSQEEYVTETTPPNTVGKSQAGGLASPRSQFRDSRTQTHPRYRSDTATELLRSAPFLPTTSATDREPRYHGPTSALFDEKPSDRGISRRDTDTVASEGLAKSRLMAEAARQRQLEAIHLATNKLDFDGVDPSLGMHLLSIYFIRQHDYGMAVYRPVFMRDMACGGPYFSKLLLNAIYFAASTYSRRAEIRHEPEDIRTAGLPYRQRFMELLIAAFDTSEITTIQALIIIANPLFTRCDERSISWLYAGIAFNMIIDLGIHIDISAPTTRTRSEEDLEVRRRVFWAAYVKDKVLSLYQGRPARLREFDTNVTLTFLDEYEELEQFNSLNHTDGEDQPGFPMYSVSTFKAECKLSILMDRIISCLYSEKSPKRNPDDLLRDALALHDDLKAWRVALPTLLDFTSPGSHTSTLLPHMFSLLAMFNVLVILLHRPFVSDGHLQCTSSSAAFDSFVTCATAATEIDHILHAYGRAFQIEYSPYIMAYATYVSATIHVRMAAQRHPGSEAHKSLRTCLHVLSKLQQVYLAPRSAIRIIHSLMKRMGVVIDDHESVRLGHESSGLPDVATWVRSQNGQEFSRGISSSNTDNIENTSRIPPAEIQPDVDLALQDLDMDAIIQSFYLDQQIAQQSLQYSQFQSTVDLSSSDLSPNTRTVRVSASHPVGVMVPSSPASCNVLQDSVAPTLYDPIFGIDTPALLEDDSRLRSGP